MLIKNARLIDANGEQTGDLLIENGKIAKIGLNINADNHEVVNANGLCVMPAFVELHCHFRTPGFEHKEDIITGSLAAAAGGYTFVNCMANTKPVCSNEKIAFSVMQQAADNGICEVNQTISITKDFDGVSLEHLYSINTLKIISDDGKGVQSAKTMLNAMKIAKEKGMIIFSHGEDMELSPIDYRLAEDLETIRNIELAKATGARLHMSHVSTIGAMQAIENGKKQGARLTCEVGPHHIYFHDFDYKVNPPIRTKADVEYLISAIKNGSVDAIATDHAPHTDSEKSSGAPGMVGLETAFAVCYTTLCCENGVTLSRLSALLSKNPAEILNVNKGQLQVGYDGDIVIIDTQKTWTVDRDKLHSKSKNTPWHGTTLAGKIVATIKGGSLTYKEEGVQL